MADFEPEAIVDQLAPLKRLLERRQASEQLLSMAGLNARFEKQLQAIIGNTEKLQQIGQEEGLQVTSDDQNPNN